MERPYMPVVCDVAATIFVGGSMCGRTRQQAAGVTLGRRVGAVVEVGCERGAPGRVNLPAHGPVGGFEDVAARRLSLGGCVVIWGRRA